MRSFLCVKEVTSDCFYPVLKTLQGTQEAAFARRRVIDPRAQSRRWKRKVTLPPDPLVLLCSRHSGCICGAARLQRIA